MDGGSARTVGHCVWQEGVKQINYLVFSYLALIIFMLFGGFTWVVRKKKHPICLPAPWHIENMMDKILT